MRDAPKVAQGGPHWQPFWPRDGCPHPATPRVPGGPHFGPGRFSSFCCPSPIRAKFGASTFRFGCRSVRVRFGGKLRKLVVAVRDFHGANMLHRELGSE